MKAPLDLPFSQDHAIELDRGPRYGDTLTLRFIELNNKGLGVAHLDALVGPQRAETRYVVTARDLLPGELAQVSVRRQRKRQVEAVLVELLEPSSERQTPECVHFGPRSEPGRGCGGCALQHVPYAAQLARKQHLVASLMVEVKGASARLSPIIACRTPWYYRNKMEFSFGDHQGCSFALGLHPAGRRYDVLDLKMCLIFEPWVAQVLPEFSAWCASHQLALDLPKREDGFLRQLTLREGKRTGERLAELVTVSTERAVMDGEEHSSKHVASEALQALAQIAKAAGAPLTTLVWTQHHARRGSPTRFIEEVLAGPGTFTEAMEIEGAERLSFEIHARAFFQPNTLQAERLYGEVLRAANLLGERGEEPAPRKVLDLYCGTGTIALCLAPHAEHVIGIELNPEAVENAERNAERNGLRNLSFFAGDVGKVLQEERFKEATQGAPIDLIVVDPPRAGLMPEALDHLRALNAPRLVYVSCNPKALRRDLLVLTLEAGYVVESIQPVDMFPQTMHIECVVALVKTLG